MTDWTGDPPRQLDELQAFDAMCAFLEAYWILRGKQSNDIAALLGDISRDMWANGTPGDPAAWSNWQDAVGKVLREEG